MTQVKRFWCNINEDYTLSYEGYLDDPENESWLSINTNLKSFNEISNINCLMLLGEPGIGKSTCLEEERTLLNQKLTTNECLLYFDLRSYGSEERLINNIFNNNTFNEWLNDENKTLHLFLDSLDECLLRIDHCTTIIIEELNKLKANTIKNRLFLRIACRTAEKPEILTSTLKLFYGEDQFSEYTLTPLRKQDIKIISKERGINNTDQFIIEIETHEAVPLAIKPITLKFLIDLYKINNNFTTNRCDLYKDGCLELCKEDNPSRIASRRTGKYTKNQRLLIASRIAFCTIFGNKYAILNNDNNSFTDEIIQINELEGNETCNDQTFFIDQEAIKETLSTGLFSSRGTDKIGWAHQTYAEYLAAQYLINNNLNIDKIISLLTLNINDEKKVYPQYYQTVLWLADLNNDILNKIIEFDPIIFLNQDVPIQIKTDSCKKELLLKIIEIYDDNKSYERSNKLFSRLYYQGIDKDLINGLENTNNKFTKICILNIARLAKVKELESYILSLALDEKQDNKIRTYSVVYLKELGSDESLKSLLTLLPIISKDDPNDELKGILLSTLYPKGYITTQQVFDWLTYPQNDNFWGTYKNFIYYDLKNNLTKDNLNIALKWLEREDIDQFNKNKTSIKLYPFTKLILAILKLAFDNINNENVTQPFIDLIALKLKPKDYHFFEIFKKSISEKNNNYKILLKFLIPLIIQNNVEPYNFQFYLHLSNEDLNWLFNELNQESDINYKKGLRDLINYFGCYMLDYNNFEKLVVFNKSDPILKDTFDNSLFYCELNKQSEKTKEDYYARKKREEESKPKLLDPPPKKRIEDVLKHIDSGKIDNFWWLCRQLSLNDDSQNDNGWYDNIVSQPGWINANETNQKRIINAAKSYIIECDIYKPDFLSSNSFNESDHAFYKALRLIYTEKNDYLNSFEPNVWNKLITIIANSYCCFHDDIDEIDKAILRIFYKKQPETFKTTIVESFKDSNVYKNIDFILDENFKAYLNDKLFNNELEAEIAEKILGKFIVINYQPTIDFLKQSINKPDEEFNIEYITIGLYYGNNELWDHLWPIAIKKGSTNKIVKSNQGLHSPIMRYLKLL